MVEKRELDPLGRFLGHYITPGTERVCIVLAGLFFLAMRTNAFIQIVGDIIQIAAILVPFVIAFMVLLLSIDIGFNIPLPSGAAERLARRREDLANRLSVFLRDGVALIVVALITKSLAVWYIGRGFPAYILNHSCAFLTGALLANIIFRLGDIRGIFGYLIVGSSISQQGRFGEAEKPD